MPTQHAHSATRKGYFLFSECNFSSLPSDVVSVKIGGNSVLVTGSWPETDEKSLEASLVAFAAGQFR